MRYYETFYAINTDDWIEDFSTAFVDNHEILVKEYINEACSTVTSSTATTTHKFLYPHHIKKTYFIEGVIKGHITLAASSCTSTVTSYRVSVCKVHEDAVETELFTTGWVTVNDTLAWDAVYSIGDEMVYPFWIDAWEKEELGEFDRIYLKVQTSSNNCTVLWHSNDATWEDVKIEIPFKM